MKEILVYSNKTGPRLEYILNQVFQNHLGCEVEITQDEIYFGSSKKKRINYSNKKLDDDLHIPCNGLLFEQDISEKEINFLMWGKLPAFFGMPHADIPFDLLASAFYLISRYEEYLPFEPDAFERFPHHISCAFQGSFLHLPLVDLWMVQIARMLNIEFEANARYSFLPTYDIDIAYSYRGKGIRRNIGGFIRDFMKGKWTQCRQRLAVLWAGQKDSYDAYEALDKLHAAYQIKPIYFLLLSQGGPLDKNLHPATNAMKKLIQTLKAKYTCGIHPSWESHSHEDILRSEIRHLGGKVFHSRQHYIRFNLPDTYRLLLLSGIRFEYSMGYGSINGFRASTSHPFIWFDLKNNASTELMVHPFCFMECNARFEQKQDTLSSLEEMRHYKNVVQSVGGQYIMIWHNFALGSEPEWTAWKDIYVQFIHENHSKT